jgi:hypothetical protein
MPKTKQQTDMGAAQSTSVGHIARDIDSKDTLKRTWSQAKAGPSDQSSVVVDDSEAETHHDVEGSQRPLKRKRFWIEVPPLPKWAKRSMKTSKRKDVWEEVDEMDLGCSS